MADREKRIPQLNAALQRCGACDEDIADAVRNIQAHKIGDLGATEMDEEKPGLDVFALKRTRAFLQGCLGTHPHSDEEQIIQRSIDEIDAQISMHHRLKFSGSLSVQGEFPPIPTSDLVNAFHEASDPSVRSMVEEELEARFSAAYDLLDALHGSRPVARLNRLLDLKTVSSQGFSRSIVKSPEALAEITENLAITRRALGAQRFRTLPILGIDWTSCV